MTALNCIGVLAHPKRPPTFSVAEAIVRSLRECDIQVWHHNRWEDSDVTADVQRADMVIAIGGDGAMLRASRVCAPYSVPVLGVNMGRLGFLSEIASPDDWQQASERLLRGDYWIESRMMITAAIWRDDECIAQGNALNDVVIAGDSVGHIVQLDTYIDENWATTYNCDGLIIATPTGSTAYALAVGGPILPPDLLNILVVPSAAHLSMDRPIVLSEGSKIHVRQSASNRNPVVVMIDGGIICDIQAGDIVSVHACDYSSKFVRMRQRNYFYRSLLDRLEPRINHDADEHSDQIIPPEDLRTEN